MNKRELRGYVLEAAKELTGNMYRKADAELMVDAVTLAIENALVDGHNVDLHGFGHFILHSFPERTVKSLHREGELYTIAPFEGVKFKPGKRLKTNVARGFARCDD